MPDTIDGYNDPICVFCLSGEDFGYWAGYVEMNSQCGG